MKIRRLLALALSIIFLEVFMTSCTEKQDKSSQKQADVNISASIPKVSETDAETETAYPQGTAVMVNDGDAYLSFADQGWNATFMANENGEVTGSVAYDAVTADIIGNGTYIVSLTSKTQEYYNASGYDMMFGIGFAAVIIKDDSGKFQNAVITIDNIKIDDKEVPMIADCYTTSDSKTERRANIYNAWSSTIPAGSVTKSGSLEGASAQIIDKNGISSYSKIEVTFTVSNYSE